MRRVFIGRKIAGFFLLAVAGLVLFSGIVMLLWNDLMPGLFHLPVITFSQAVGLLILSKLLFGGFRGGWGGGCGGRWRHKLQQRWMDMTPEERERFKQEWGRRGGPYEHRFRGEGQAPNRRSEEENRPAQEGPGH